jgi:hypothetical protein
MLRRQKRHTSEQIGQFLRGAHAMLAGGKTIDEVCQANRSWLRSAWVEALCIESGSPQPILSWRLVQKMGARSLQSPQVGTII